MREPTAKAADRPADHDARHAATTVLDRNVFVEAGAGSGKTTLLVARVVALVGHPDRPAPIESIAAITFTERAALELRDRLRKAFEERARQEPANARWANALVGLDGAAIGTIHAFAQRILRDHWRQAGLPPSFTVADDAASALAFDARWRTLAGRLFASTDTELARGVRLALASRVTVAQIRQLAKSLDETWDLTTAHLRAPAPPVPPLGLEPLLDELDALVALADGCLTPDDLLARHVRTLAVLASGLRLQPDDAGQLGLLVDVKFTFKNGKKENWLRVPGGKEGVLGRLDQLQRTVDALKDRVQQAALAQLAAAVGAEVTAAAEHRRRTGQLEFHDLLVMTRDLLRDPAHGPTVRADLHERFRQLLLDEFQDTDPIQLEIAVLIAADPADPGAPTDPLPVPRPGRLFFVGDPKQSIYRFRRADIGTYLGARRAYGDPEVELNVNFRSTKGVIDWVNKVFRRLVTERDGSQARYRSLQSVRPPVPGPAVMTIGVEHDDSPYAEELRAREAADVAMVLASAIGSWPVSDGNGGVRPARADDIAVLIPTRTVLPALEDALHEHGVPARVEAGSLLFGGDEIAEALTVVRAAVVPHDEIAVVAALRTSLLGVSEADLYRHRVPARRDLDPRLPHDPDGSPVERALHDLGRWHALTRHAGPSAVLGAILHDRRGWELAAGHARGRDALRRLRVLVESARAYADDVGGTAADWLGWIDRQRSDGARWSEPLVDEPDDDAVRILTIHAAKGLEFPIVVVTGLTGRPGGRPVSTRVLWPREPGPPEIKLARGLTSASYDDAADLDAQLDDDERVRLLYVACTRARDHLVVSLHRTPTTGSQRTLATVLADAGAAEAASEVFAQQGLPFGLAVADTTVAPATAAPPPRPATLPPVLSATALVGLLTGEPEGDDDGDHEPAPARDDVDPLLDRAGVPSGSAFGRAVHAVLERVPLLGVDTVVPPEVADDAARAEGLDGAGHHVAAAALVAARQPVVAAASTCAHWRELYVAVPLGEVLVEGYVDLLVRTPDGLVVVDYKTDARPPDDGSVHPKHRLQLALYAHAVAHATGEPVVGAYAVYVKDEARAERAVTDLAAAIAEVTTAPVVPVRG